MNSEEYSDVAFLKSSYDLLNGDRNIALRDVLAAKYGQLKFAFVIDWIPEQGEDIYTVVIPSSKIAVIEIPRSKDHGDQVSIEETPIHQYRKRVTGKDKRKMLAVVELLMKKLAPE